jgi:hypothetical protein
MVSSTLAFLDASWGVRQCIDSVKGCGSVCNGSVFVIVLSALAFLDV